jgi:hypothetical protein
MKTRFDIWKATREGADVLPNGIKVGRGTDALGRPTAHIFMPKAIKPCGNHYYRTDAEREAHITRMSDAYDQRQRERAEYRTKAATGDLTLADPGAIFCNSWGYEQTQSDFYQVVKRSGNVVWIRPIVATMVRAVSDMAEYVRPVKDGFVPERCAQCRGGKDVPEHFEACGRFDHHYEPKAGSNTYRKRVTFYEGKPCLSFSYGAGSLVARDAITGEYESHYRSHYA